MFTRPHHGEHRMVVTFCPSLLERQIHCRKLRIEIGRFTCPSRPQMMSSRSETLLHRWHRRDTQQGPTHVINDDLAVEHFHGLGLGKAQDPGRGRHPEKEVCDACAADSCKKSKPSSSHNFPIRTWSPILNSLHLENVTV